MWTKKRTVCLGVNHCLWLIPLRGDKEECYLSLGRIIKVAGGKLELRLAHTSTIRESADLTVLEFCCVVSGRLSHTVRYLFLTSASETRPEMSLY